MKKLFTFFTVILFISEVFAQSPEKMSYQAMIRNSENALVSNTKVGMQISILQGSVFGASVYVETQTPTTNANGLVSIEIGGEDATILHGSLSEIDWSDGPYFIKTETDLAGGTNYSISGVSQLLSVPYALHAKTAETVMGGVSETDPVFSESEAFNITADDITNLDSLSGENTGDQDLSFLATKTALSDSISHVRSEISNESGGVSQAALVDTAANLRSVLATKTALSDSISQVRSEISIEGVFATQVALADTTDDLRSALATKIALGDSTAQVRSEIPAAADGSETQVTAGTNVTVTGSGTNASPYVVNAIPILSQSEIDALNPTEGLIVYNEYTHKINYYNGMVWIEL